MYLYQKITITISLIVIFFYLLFSYPHIFSEIEEDIDVGEDSYFSKTLDLKGKNTFVWKIEESQWERKTGEAELFIRFERDIDKEVIENYRKSDMELSLEINAYAIGEDDQKNSRLVKNWYYKDLPLSEDSAMCSIWASDYVEHCLGIVWLYPYEDLYIEVTVINEDSYLSNTNPKLRIVGKHDYAVFGYPIKLIKNILFILPIIALLLIGFYTLRR